MRPEFVFENYEGFFGDVDQIRRIMNSCDNCGNDVVLSHVTDYSEMFVQESASCPVCGGKRACKLHSLN